MNEIKKELLESIQYRESSKKLYTLIYTIEAEYNSLMRLYSSTKNEEFREYIKAQLDLVTDLMNILEEEK